MLANISLRSKRRPQTRIKWIKLLFSIENTCNLQIYNSCIFHCHRRLAEFWLWASAPNNMLIFRVAVLTLAWGMRCYSLLDVTNEHNLNSSKWHTCIHFPPYIYISLYIVVDGDLPLWPLKGLINLENETWLQLSLRLELFTQTWKHVPSDWDCTHKRMQRKNWLTNLGRSPLAVANGWSSVKHRMTWNHRTLAQQERHTVRQST